MVLPLLKTDLLTLMLAVREGRLSEYTLENHNGAAACVIIASGGYPQKYSTGFEINSGDTEKMQDITVYHAGTKLEGGRLVTSGGRVLGVTAVAPTLAGALDKAYAAVGKISFDGAFYRRDIGRKGL